MLSNRLTIAGNADNVPVLTCTYNSVLTFEQVDAICEALRSPLNDLGERIKFTVTIIDDNF